MIARWMNGLISKVCRDASRTFFEPTDFGWSKKIEQGHQEILRELMPLLDRRDDIPNFQDLSDRQRDLTDGDQWKTLFLYAYGTAVEENRVLFPLTDKLLGSIPGMKTAMFSILAPGKHIPEHCGPYKGVLRYHLGLIVPQPEALCRIRVGQDTRSWRIGESLVFDDSHPHEVWNDSTQSRVVLFVDFLRPLPFPVNLLNRLVVWMISLSPYVTVAVGRAREAARRTALAVAPGRE